MERMSLLKPTVPIRTAPRAGLFLKVCLTILVIVFILNIYSTSNNSELWKRFQDENVTIQKIQEKFSDFVKEKGRGISQMLQQNNFDNFDDLTEKQRAELIGLDDGITEEARQIMNELNITEAGEWGRPVVFNLTSHEEIQKQFNQLSDTYGYNALASSMISLNRALPDNRSEYCRTKEYPRDLPKASVVIPFHDDDWMLLMRTVHSVLLRTPDRLLEEILLVHDHSDREYFGTRLDEYIKKYPKIRLIRSHRRQGIIPTRILGGRNAVGPIIVYLDSHVEVAPGWIEPMLARIAEEPTLLAWANIRTVAANTLQVRFDDSPGMLGSFRWDLIFQWMSIRRYEGDKPTEKYAPKPTVTIIGPCYAIRKDFYMKIGLLDPDFDIRGSEDVELAFRVWMCGGRVELIPCSVVANMFKAHTYSGMTEKGGMEYNNNRIAEMWLDDDYKKVYYRALPKNKTRNFGDVTERLKLKEKLGCKSFKWFMDNVHPTMKVPYYLTDEGWEKKMAAEEKQKREEKRRLEEEVRKEDEERKQKEEAEKMEKEVKEEQEESKVRR